MTITDFVGTLGLVLVLGAYVANALGKLSAADSVYHAMNALGSGILVWYSWQLGSMIFMALEGVWSAFAFVKLARSRRRGG